jgi:hypothetical protein
VFGFRAKIMGDGGIMSSKSVAGNTCVWCDVAATLEEKITGLKSVACKTCVLCVAAVMAALTLLAVTWTVILVSN